MIELIGPSILTGFIFFLFLSISYFLWPTFFQISGLIVSFLGGYLLLFKEFPRLWPLKATEDIFFVSFVFFSIYLLWEKRILKKSFLSFFIPMFLLFGLLWFHLSSFLSFKEIITSSLFWFFLLGGSFYGREISSLILKDKTFQKALIFHFLLIQSLMALNLSLTGSLIFGQFSALGAALAGALTVFLFLFRPFLDPLWFSAFYTLFLSGLINAYFYLEWSLWTLSLMIMAFVWIFILRLFKISNKNLWTFGSLGALFLGFSSFLLNMIYF